MLVPCLLTFTLALAPGRPLVGVAANPPAGSTGAQFLVGVRDAQRMGCRLMTSSHKWSELEPKPGEYVLKPLEDALNGLPLFGFTVALTIQTLDTNNRTLPPDLMEKPLDSPEVRSRFDALVRKIAAKLGKRCPWVMLANEADVYLATHPSELEPFCTLMDQGRRTLRAARPDILVGVTCTHDGLRDRPAAVGRMNREMDVCTLTYYPLGPGFGVRPVGDVPADMARMVRGAGGKPLLIQEIGYPAAELLGSSGAKQAAFVDAVFDAAERHASAIAGLCFFILHDFGDKLTDELLSYYRLPDPRFRAYLATLGLKEADGKPRPAYERFEARVARWLKGGGA
ncbi:MAG: hypothetical protein NT029_13275 [Armatimonadetes bacterium]|nr:hypothetical protein [Armatimonadota bacterium]